MGRKSRTDARREEILAAFERCIGRYGIDAPLERIAEEAGVQRSLIRHHLGNRDELVEQVVARIAAAYPRRVAELLEPALAHGTEAVLDVFFAEGVSTSEWDDVIHAVTSAAQGRYPQARQQVAQMMEAIVARTAESLAALFPRAPAEARYAVTYAVLCIVQSHEELRWLGVDGRHTAMARAGARSLLEGLASYG